MEAALVVGDYKLAGSLVLHPINQDKEHDNSQDTRDDPDHCY